MSSQVQTLELAGRQFVVLEAGEYERLKAAADSSSDGPRLPKPDRRGYVPAIEYSRASIARELIARRRKAGLSVAELARKAKVGVQTLRRLEEGKSIPSVAAVDKLDRALKAAKA
jgi:ribosome-binding protein aMBF1 (putative translation factor)